MGLFNSKAEPQPQPDVSQAAYYPPINMENKRDLVDVYKLRLNSEDLIQEMEHNLMGLAWNGHEWVKAYQAWCNENGLACLKSIYSSYVSRGIYLGNLSQDQINFKMCSLKINLAKLIFSKGKLFGIDKEKRSLLIQKICDVIHVCMTRAEAGMESSLLSRTTERREIVTGQNPQQKSSVLGGLFRFGSGGKDKNA